MRNRRKILFILTGFLLAAAAGVVWVRGIENGNVAELQAMPPWEHEMRIAAAAMHWQGMGERSLDAVLVAYQTSGELIVHRPDGSMQEYAGIEAVRQAFEELLPQGVSGTVRATAHENGRAYAEVVFAVPEGERVLKSTLMFNGRGAIRRERLEIAAVSATIEGEAQ